MITLLVNDNQTGMIPFAFFLAILTLSIKLDRHIVSQRTARPQFLLQITFSFSESLQVFVLNNSDFLGLRALVFGGIYQGLNRLNVAELRNLEVVFGPVVGSLRPVDELGFHLNFVNFF